MEVWFQEFLALPLSVAIWRIFFWYFGWLPLALLFLKMSSIIWLKWRRGLWFAQQKWLLLAIDAPELNEQSCKAVEQLFTVVSGAHKNINLLEKWWQGMLLPVFSFEIVGLEGYIQFLIRTPVQFRALVETAVYAQYPQAEISEVEDYTENTPRKFPDPDYDLWGAEFVYTQNHMLPLKCYREFEHIFGPPETTYRDPMGNLMDLMSFLHPGEQLWYQIIVIPGGFDWMKEGEEQIKVIAGLKKKSPGLFSALFREGNSFLADLITSILHPMPEVAPQKEDKAEFSMLKLTPAQQKKVEGITRKIGSIALECKIRMVYLARKEVINKPKVVAGFMGFIKQFTDNNANGLKPDMERTATSGAYLFANARILRRQTKIIRNYAARDEWRGRSPFIMVPEELATIWHFPLSAITAAPLLQRAAARRAEAPMALPVSEGHYGSTADIEPIFEPGYEVTPEPSSADSFEPLGSSTDQPPDNLPIA